jgi:cell filamentation protein
MYDAVADPYCYPGTTVLKNRANLRTQKALDRFEVAMTTQRADEPLPAGRLSVTQYRAIHRHLFQDVFSWAGQFRTVRIARSGSAFCYPENIAREMRILFKSLARKKHLCGLSREAFAQRAAAFLTTLNAIHPFREGNGRTQTAFLALLADRAGYPLDLGKLKPKPFLNAMIASFRGDEGPLTRQIAMLTRAQHTPRRIGVAKGKFKVPADIDADNAAVAAMFKGKTR